MFLCWKFHWWSLYQRYWVAWAGSSQPLLNTRSLCVCPTLETEGSPRLTCISIHSYACTRTHMCAVSTLCTSHVLSRKFWWTFSMNKADEVQRKRRRDWGGGGGGGARALEQSEGERGRSLHTSFQKQYFAERLAIWIFWTQDYGWCLSLFFPLLPLWLPQTQPLACMETLYDDNHPAAAWTALQSTKEKQWVIWVCLKIDYFGYMEKYSRTVLLHWLTFLSRTLLGSARAQNMLFCTYQTWSVASFWMFLKQKGAQICCS